MQSDGRQMYGHYVMIPCAKTAGKEEKLQAVEKGLQRIMKELRGSWPVPDFDMMEFIVHEGLHSQKSLSWYPDGELDDMEEVMYVAIKFNPKGEQQ